MQRELPVLDTRLCTACGDCVSVCPTQCLSKSRTKENVTGSNYPYLARPRECISCSLCVLVCPTDAIGMKRVDSI